ncbi:MAG: hypothetical protein GY937_03770, partial [bacterium]|nr:hypothetical protein [bacterium]
MPQLAQRSLASGELSPAAQARSDLAKYLSGLNLCENYYVKAQGGAYNRPGWRFINVLDDSTRKGRLIEFSFNTEQTYMLVFEHLKVRVIRDGGLILAGGGPAIFELVTPYTEDQLPTLGFSQDADVMTLTHKSHDPASLSRIADDNWTLTTNDYSPTVDTPAFNASDTVSSITNITKANPAVVTSPGHGWDEGNLVEVKSVVGMTELNDRLFRVTDIVDGVSYALDGEDSTGYTAYVSGGNAFRSNGATTIGSGFGDFEKTYTYVVTAVDLDGVESLASVPGIITTQSLSTTGAVKLRWDSVSGADYYRVYKDPSVNSQVYGWIGDSKTLYFEDYNVAPLTSDTPPEAREPFAAAGDKPGVSTYYQQRQVFASTSNEPQRSDVTQVGNPSSLRTSHPARAADAFTFTIKAQQVNEIRHLLPLGDLIVLTSGGVWKVTEGADGVLTPATAGVRIQSYVGASKVPPVVVNSTALYVQYAGARVRDLGYEYTSNKYTGNDLSIYAMHLFGGHSIVDMAYAEEPDSILWCVRDDGTLIGLTYQREHQVWGWHRHTTLGEVESAASILEDGRSAVYLIVKRNINGTDVRHI